MKNNLSKYVIKCWSEIRSTFAPTAHPEFDSPSEARAYGDKHIKGTEFIVEPK